MITAQRTIMKIDFTRPCFNEEQREFKNKFLEKFSGASINSGHGNNDITIIDAFDYAANIGGDIETKLNMAESIKIECIRLLESCDIIIVLIDGNDTHVLPLKQDMPMLSINQ